MRFRPTLTLFALFVLAASPALATVVSGRVTTPGGAGIANVDLDFIDRDTNQSIPLINDNTDLLGFYAINVPSGDYDIQFEPDPGDRFVAVEIRGERVEGGSMVFDQELESGWFVTGRVIDESAAALANLDLDFVDLVDGGVVFTPSDNTDLFGNFSVVVPGSSFEVQVEPPVGSSLVPASVFVNVSGDTSIGDVVLQQGVRLSGNIVDPGGSPAATILVRTLDPSSGEEIFNIRNRTDPLGVYDLVLAPGAYDLFLIPPGGSPLLPRLIVGVTLQSDLTLPTIALDAGVVASGLVLAPSSDPADGTDLDFTAFLSGIESFTPRDNADKDGLYDIAVRPGTYDVTFNPPASTGFAAKRLANVNLLTDTTLPTVQLEIGRTVSGTVRNGGGVALPGVDLDFIGSAGGVEIETNGDDTDALGAFSVLVPDGTYDIEFSPVDGSGVAQQTLLSVTVNGNLSLGTITLGNAAPASGLEITPGTGSATGGTRVTVTGSGFAPGVKVRLGGASLRDLALLNSTTIQGNTPVHPAGPVTVEVTNPGAASAALPSPFNYTTPAVDPSLIVERTGPLGTDILLQWSGTGQPSYTIFRSANPASFATAPQTLDVVTGTSFRDDGAASPTGNSILFYLVQ